MKEATRGALILQLIDINGKQLGTLGGSKLSEAEKKAKEPAILRKGISEKGNCLEKWNSTYPGNRLKGSPGREV